MIVSPTTRGRRAGRRRQPAGVVARPRDPFLQADAPVIAEVRGQQPGASIHRGQVAISRPPDYPRLFAVLPVGHPAVVPGRRQRRTARLVDAWIVDPERLARAGIDRGRLVQRGGQVQHAVDHQRRRRQAGDARARHPEVGIPGFQVLEHSLGRNEGNAVLVLDRQMRIRGAPAPRQLQTAEVVAVDLVERRVLRAPGVRRVGTPLAIGPTLLGAGGEGHEPRCQECPDQSPLVLSHATRASLRLPRRLADDLRAAHRPGRRRGRAPVGYLRSANATSRARNAAVSRRPAFTAAGQPA